MIVKELKEKDQIIKELLDSDPGRTGYFIYPESPVEESLVKSLVSSLQRCFDPLFQVGSALCDLRQSIDGQISRFRSGDSSMLRPRGKSIEDKAV